MKKQRNKTFTEQPVGWLLGFASAALLCGAGCLHTTETTRPARSSILFDTNGGTDWRNHVKVVPDPTGGSSDVLIGERVSPKTCQMTFTRKTAFFIVPDKMAGAVSLRLLAQNANRVKVALVSGKKIKNYYRNLPIADEWCEVILPLSESEGKLQPGDMVNDITLWLVPSEGEETLPQDARFYLSEASYITVTE